MRIGIIGTAGRKPYTDMMTLDLYRKMYSHLRLLLLGRGEYNFRILVSGGAAWSDHLAVKAFNRLTPQLELHLPCSFDYQNTRFSDTNPTGRTANYYHELFSKECGFDSLAEIKEAINHPNCMHTVSNGFHARNLLVGKVDLLIAFTWGEGSIPAGGGTHHTWDNSKAQEKIHIPLESL